MRWIFKNEERVFLALAIILSFLLLLVCIKTVGQHQKELDLVRAVPIKCEGL